LPQEFTGCQSFDRRFGKPVLAICRLLLLESSEDFERGFVDADVRLSHGTIL